MDGIYNGRKTEKKKFLYERTTNSGIDWRRIITGNVFGYFCGGSYNIDAHTRIVSYVCGLDDFTSDYVLALYSFC